MTTGTDGFAKVWLAAASKGTCTLDREVRFHDHSVIDRCMLGPWLLTTGKDGGGERDVCGLDSRLKSWNIGENNCLVVELLQPVVAIWSVVTLESLGKVVLALMKKSRPTLEIWGTSLTKS